MLLPCMEQSTLETTRHFKKTCELQKRFAFEWPMRSAGVLYLMYRVAHKNGDILFYGL